MLALDPAAVWCLLCFGFFVPYVALRSRQRMKAGVAIPPRKRVFTTVLVMQALFLAVALVTARRIGYPVLARGTLGVKPVLLALALLALGLGTLPARWRRTPDDEKRRLLLSRPQEPRDLGMWLLVSLAAGTVEEIVYRGVLHAILYYLTGSWWGAAAISVLLFAVGHATQGVRRAAIVALLAAGCHLLVRMTGALLLAMAVHFLYDFVAGVIYVGLARRMPAGAPS